MARAYSYYIKFVVRIITTSDIKVVVKGANNNTSINENTRKITTYFVYNKELDIGLIWSTTCIDRSYCTTTRSTSHFIHKIRNNIKFSF